MWKSISVIILMNGLKIQWGTTALGNQVATKVNFYVSYTQKPTVTATINTSSLDPTGRNMFQIYDINTSYFYMWGNTAKPQNGTWIAIGY